MSGSLNKVTIIGNVGNDPEIRSMNSGDRVANLSIATSESWKDKQSGEKREKTEWHRVVVWNEHLVKVIDDYVNKGDKLYIEGKLQTRKWQDQSGNDRYSTEIVLQGFDGKLLMLGGKKSDQDDSRGSYGRQETESYGGFDSRGNAVESDVDIDDDPIPF